MSISFACAYPFSKVKVPPSTPRPLCASVLGTTNHYHWHLHPIEEMCADFTCWTVVVQSPYIASKLTCIMVNATRFLETDCSSSNLVCGFRKTWGDVLPFLIIWNPYKAELMWDACKVHKASQVWHQMIRPSGSLMIAWLIRTYLAGGSQTIWGKCP